MSEDLQNPPRRGWFTGVTNIVLFNPWFFLAALMVLLIVGVLLSTLAAVLQTRLPLGLQFIGWLGFGLAAWWLLGSLFVSWWVYDLSGLYRWSWLRRILGTRSRKVVIAHAGFDEVSVSLRAAFPQWNWTVVDFHDATKMTEASIRRARRRCPPVPGTVSVSLPDPWPLTSGFEAVLFPLSAHEWRRGEERVSLLRSAAAVLDKSGRIILLEHLRDGPNFLAFGPGFLHFHSFNTWRSDWQAAGLRCTERFTITPFVAAFVLQTERGEP